MSSRTHERRTERATADEVAEVERQLWEFAKRIEPPSVPEAKLRPGAFLWRIHRTWHSLGRGTGGLASRSFRALRDELLTRDPPVRNLQPKLYGNSPLAHAEAEQLIDTMLESWHLERGRNGKWQAGPLTRPNDSKPAVSQDLEAIRENLLHTLYKGDDQLLLEEPVGVPPEIFMEERGRSSLALIIPTVGETITHLSPSDAYSAFSKNISRFCDAAAKRKAEGEPMPLLIWMLDLGVIRDNANFHQDFHCLAIYSASLTNWYLRLSRERGDKRIQAERYWRTVMDRSAFVLHGLPEWISSENDAFSKNKISLDEDLADLTSNFFVPRTLPIVLGNNRLVRRYNRDDFGLNVSVEANSDDNNSPNTKLRYWLFPNQPRQDANETTETTGLPVFDAELSPGEDFDLAYRAIYQAASHHLGISQNDRSLRSLITLSHMGWRIFSVTQFQECLLVSAELLKPSDY